MNWNIWELSFSIMTSSETLLHNFWMGMMRPDGHFYYLVCGKKIGPIKFSVVDDVDFPLVYISVFIFLN